jgi:light-regulated signal transduction histidine kinase (bacteriophytochrome)
MRTCSDSEDLQRFAYVVAHDLRSPLNASLNLLELLARRTNGTQNEQDARTLELAVNNLQRLGALSTIFCPTRRLETLRISAR